MAAFVREVSLNNSGAADAAWRLLRRVADAWCPTSEGAKGSETQRSDKKVNQFTKHRATSVAGGFGLKNAPRPTTLIRLAETFGSGPKGGGIPTPRTGTNAKDRTRRDGSGGLRLARGASEGPRARATREAARAPLHRGRGDARASRARRRRTRRRSTAGGARASGSRGRCFPRAAAAAEEAATEGLPASHFAAEARGGTSRRRRRRRRRTTRGRWRSTTSSRGTSRRRRARSPARRAISRLPRTRARAAEAAALAAGEAGGGAEENPSTLTSAAARAALADIRLHTVVARAREKLERGDTAELLDSLAPPAPPRPGGKPRRGGGGRGAGDADAAPTRGRAAGARRRRASGALETVGPRGEIPRGGLRRGGEGARGGNSSAGRSARGRRGNPCWGDDRGSPMDVAPAVKSLGEILEFARRCLDARGPRAFAPDRSTRDPDFAGAAFHAVASAMASLAPLVSRVMDRAYSARAFEPGKEAAEARRKALLKTENERERANWISALERASEALAIIQQLTARADDPLRGLPADEDAPEGGAKKGRAAGGGERKGAAFGDVGARASRTSARRARGLPVLLRRWAARRVPARASITRLEAAREPVAAESKRLRAIEEAKAARRAAENAKGSGEACRQGEARRGRERRGRRRRRRRKSARSARRARRSSGRRRRRRTRRRRGTRSPRGRGGGIARATTCRTRWSSFTATSGCLAPSGRAGTSTSCSSSSTRAGRIIRSRTATRPGRRRPGCTRACFARRRRCGGSWSGGPGGTPRISTRPRTTRG